MSRSLKKGPYTDEKLMKKVKNSKPDHNKPIKTWARNCTIVPEMIGYVFMVHNGKGFEKVNVSEEKIGHKLGEFAPTRKFSRHGGKMQKDIEQGKK